MRPSPTCHHSCRPALILIVGTHACGRRAGSGSDQVPLDDILGSVLEWGMEEGLVLDGAIAVRAPW